MGGLAGTAQPVAFRLGEPVQARREGDGLELLAQEEPFGEVGGEVRVGGGDEAVFGMGAEVEVVGQRGILIGQWRFGCRGCWTAAGWVRRPVVRGVDGPGGAGVEVARRAAAVCRRRARAATISRPS